MQRKFQRVLHVLVVIAMALAVGGSAQMAAPGNDAASSQVQPVVARKAPIAIGALQGTGEHLRAPRDEVVVKQLQNRGMLPLNATEDQIKSALGEYKAKFAKKSDTWISPEIQAKALARETELADPNLPRSELAIQPVTATVMALAVDFGATETFTMPVEDNAGNCVTQTVTINGPLNGDIPHPGALDNNTTWYSPSLTSNPKFYEKLIFGYEGAGRVRMDLIDPRDGLPGINAAGNTVQDYYDNVAGDGNVYITGTVEGWVTVPHSEGYYGADICETGGHGGGAGVPVAQVIVDAATQFSVTHPSYYLDTTAGAFWPKYDADDDGIVDTFWIIHAGMGQEAGGGSEGTFSIWSHSSDLRYYAQWVNGFKVYEGNPGTTADDIYIGPYTTQPENADLGVFVEEFGHNFFGWPDLYTTDVDNSIGFWSAMASGIWGGYLGGAQPVGMPLWFRMIAWCGTGYCNWQEPMVTRNYSDASADVVIGQLEKTPAGVNKGVRINLPPIVEDIPNNAGSGKGAYTSAGRDSVDLTLSRQISVGAAATGTLTIGGYWEIEEDWDYGYVMVNGTLLDDVDGWFVETNPNGNNLGHGLTGIGGDILQFDLSAYKGQTVTLTIRYKTDAAVTEAGWWVDNVMLDGVLIDDFEAATAPATFPGWTNSATGWVVVPTAKSYANYYLAEWRSKTKYDNAVKTAYVTNYSDEDEWQVERVPYNIPGALLYYRNTKYVNTYNLGANQADAPSYGPKYQLLVVDMNPVPLRYGASLPHASVMGNRASSYDAALTLQPSEAFTVSQVFGAPTVTGPFTYTAKPAVTKFNDAKGYYPGFYYGSPCAVGYVCYTNRYGSAVIPARDKYSLGITSFAGNPIYGLYGISWAPSWLGSGNPGDDNVQHGVNIDLLSKAGDDAYNSTATLRFRNYSVDVVTSAPATIRTSTGAYTSTYQTVVHNNSVQASNPVTVTYYTDPVLTVASLTAEPAVGTADPATPEWSIASLAAGQTVTLTLVTTGEATASTYVEVDVEAWDGQMWRGPWFLFTDIFTYRLFMPFSMR